MCLDQTVSLPLHVGEERYGGCLIAKYLYCDHSTCPAPSGDLEWEKSFFVMTLLNESALSCPDLFVWSLRYCQLVQYDEETVNSVQAPSERGRGGGGGGNLRSTFWALRVLALDPVHYIPSPTMHHPWRMPVG